MKSLDFSYDLWANQLWLDFLPQFPDPTRPQTVFRHIIMCHHSWLHRVDEILTLKTQFPSQSLPLQELLLTYNSLWQDAIIHIHAATPINYSNSQGTVFENTFQNIATHVLNHGTYHRGHLRGLAEAANLTDFPDTDFIFYCRNPD